VFGPLANGLDVVAHEFTHGVTQYSSSLVYQGESGALNEAMSDIMAAAVERSYGSSESNTLKVGETVWTPGITGDSMRYMDDPARNYDRDWYPSRYIGNSDSGGVHWNSGIANLAFSLMVKGGTHPRNKSPGIGKVGRLAESFTDSINKAAEIFYMANIQCLTYQSGFDDAKFCTALVAGSKYRGVVLSAWDAVGVPWTLYTSLNNGAEVTGISASTKDELWFTLDGVQPGERVACETSGGEGDIAIRVQFASTSFGLNECSSSATNTTDEQCTTQKSSGKTRAYAVLTGVTDFSGVALKCSRFQTLKSGVVLSNQSAKPGNTRSYIFESVLAGEKVSCSLSGPNGDADLEVRFGSFADSIMCQSIANDSHEECTTEAAVTPTAAYITVKSYKQYSGLSIKCEKVDGACKQTLTKCMDTSECCGALTCDGPAKKKRKCKTCKNIKQPCVRNTHCCLGLKCVRGRCK